MNKTETKILTMENIHNKRVGYNKIVHQYGKEYSITIIGIAQVSITGIIFVVTDKDLIYQAKLNELISLENINIETRTMEEMKRNKYTNRKKHAGGWNRKGTVEKVFDDTVLHCLKIKYETQKYFEYIGYVDFFINTLTLEKNIPIKLIIECDEIYHLSEKQRKKDIERDFAARYLYQCETLRFSDDFIYNNVEQCKHKLAEFLITEKHKHEMKEEEFKMYMNVI